MGKIATKWFSFYCGHHYSVEQLVFAKVVAKQLNELGEIRINKIVDRPFNIIPYNVRHFNPVVVIEEPYM